MSYINSLNIGASENNFPFYYKGLDPTHLETLDKALSTLAANPISTLGELQKKINDLVEENKCLQNLGQYLLNAYLYLQQECVAANTKMLALEEKNITLSNDNDYLKEDNAYYDHLNTKNCELEQEVKKLRSENEYKTRRINQLIYKNKKYEEETKKILSLWKEKEQEWRDRENELQDECDKINNKLLTYRERINRYNMEENSLKRKHT